MKAQSWLILHKISGVQSDKSGVKEIDVFWAPGSSCLYYTMFSPQDLLYFALKEAP